VRVGDLIRVRATDRIGFVERIDVDYYGATQAFKVYQPVEHGKCIRGNMVDGFGPTKDGKRDRILVCWTDNFPEYFESTELEVISES
tara:strand:+ start:541 stop:801 length:261 start_codon:yes stop_codon:yes gene_type:complete